MLGVFGMPPTDSLPHTELRKASSYGYTLLGTHAYAPPSDQLEHSLLALFADAQPVVVTVAQQL